MANLKPHIRLSWLMKDSYVCYVRGITQPGYVGWGKSLKEAYDNWEQKAKTLFDVVGAKGERSEARSDGDMGDGVVSGISGNGEHV